MEFTGERFIECEETAGQLIEREHWQRYMVAAKLVEPGAAVLDIACGSGYGTAYLSRFAGHVYGVDISSDAVAYAEGRYGRPNLRFLQGDVSQIPLDSGSVDLVVSFETIEHVEEASQHAFLAEAKRVLRPGGRLIVSQSAGRVGSSQRALGGCESISQKGVHRGGVPHPACGLFPGSFHALSAK